MNEVAGKRLGVQLPQHGGNLPAMISAVIDHVLHGLPERIFVCAKTEGAVLVDAVEVVLRKNTYKFVQALLVFVPSRLQRGKIAELLDRYGLSLSELDLRRQSCEGIGLETDRTRRGPIDDCIETTAASLDRRVWSET